MIVKKLDFKSLFLDKIKEKLLSDELFSTLSREKETGSFILERICEVSASLILSEVDIMIKNATNQYTSLRKQYYELEQILKEKSQENSEIKLILEEKTDEIQSEKQKNNILREKIADYEIKLRENARNCDFLSERFEELCEKKEESFQRKISELIDENNGLRRLLNEKRGNERTLWEKFKEMRKQIEEMKGCLQGMLKEFYSQTADIYRQLSKNISDELAKNTVKMRTLEENIARLNDFHVRNIEKVNLWEDEFLKEKNSILIENSRLANENASLSDANRVISLELAILKQKDFDTQTKILEFEEKIAEIKVGMRNYHRICQEERKEFMERLDETNIKKAELFDLNKRIKLIKELVYEFRNIDSSKGNESFMEKINCLREKLSEIESFSEIGDSQENEKTTKTKRLSLDHDFLRIFC